jgi:hypothetical protein
VAQHAAESRSRFSAVKVVSVGPLASTVPFTITV